MIENKNHWYDGLFYDYVIAPNQDKSFSHIKNIIEANSSIIDVGCGTGRLAFQIADKCSKIDAIDLSIKNIEVARKKLSKNISDKIHFFHADANNFFTNSHHYDYAVLSYVIHEMDESLRVNILNTILQYTDKIIILDYFVPQPKNIWRLLNEVVEFAAGKDHYRNFRTYSKNEGIKGLSKLSGLKIIDEIQNSPSSSHIAVLQK